MASCMISVIHRTRTSWSAVSNIHKIKPGGDVENAHKWHELNGCEIINNKLSTLVGEEQSCKVCLAGVKAMATGDLRE